MTIIYVFVRLKICVCISDGASSILLGLTNFNSINLCYRFIFSAEQQHPAKMNWLGILTLLSLAGESRVFYITLCRCRFSEVLYIVLHMVCAQNLLTINSEIYDKC